jgi:hypothetical protein
MSDHANYGAPAELFPPPSHTRGHLRYQRFDTLAEAVRFVEEQLPAGQRAGALIEADEVRYVGAEISALYNAAGYPLPRSVRSDH